MGAMFYYRTNRDQFGQRNIAVPTSSYTQHTVNIPNGPGGGPAAFSNRHADTLYSGILLLGSSVRCVSRFALRSCGQ